jgi:hypothetical protein
MPITVKSGFWNDVYAFIDGRAPIERGIARRLNRRGMRDVRELMLELMGVAPGAAALEQYKRVTAPAAFSLTAFGGVRTIETTDLVNRVTAAADDTTISGRVLAYSSQPATYPANRDGNPRKLAGG